MELLSGMVLRLTGREEPARQAYRRAIPGLRGLIQQRPTEPWTHGWLAVALAGAGDRDSALRQVKLVKDLMSLAPDPWANPYLAQELLLQAYLLLGEHDEAITLLKELLESRHYGAVSQAWLRIDPRLDVLRNDAEFSALAGGQRQTALGR